MKRATLAAGLLASAAPTPEPTFAVGRLQTDLPGALVVGRMKSGLICGPAGSLHWRDAAPDLMRASHRAAAAMRDAGLDVAVPDPDVMEGEDERTPVRIVPTLAAIHMDACTAWRGIRLSASQASVKASGRAVVIWRAYDRRSQRLRLKVTACLDFRVDHGAPSIEQATQAMIAASGAAAAPALKAALAETAAPRPEQRIGCTDAETAALATAPSRPGS